MRYYSLITSMSFGKLQTMINNFKNRIISEFALFESESCLRSILVNLDDIAVLDKASLVITPNSYKEDKLLAIVPDNGTGDLTVARATTATRVNNLGLIEQVPANVPRLDYTNGSCPTILVEPQRTNLALYSEQFNNAIWTTNGNQITISENSTISPDGNSTADSILTTTENGSHYIQQRTGSATAGLTYTMSVYVKKLGYDYCRIQTSNTGSALCKFRFSTKTLTISGVNVVANSGKVTEMANGWFRIEMSILAPFSVSWRWWIVCLNDFDQEVFFGDVTKGLYVWGFQFEVGSNATSYIPTVASSVTRNADVISKTGISSLIGQTEGTIFADFNLTNNDLSSNKTIFAIDDNSYYVNIITARIFNTNILNVQFRANSIGIIFLNMPVMSNGNHKIAIRYGSGFASIFVDGVFINTQVWTNSFTAPISQLFIGKNRIETPYFNDRIKSTCLFKTALTDTECIQLTT